MSYKYVLAQGFITTVMSKEKDIYFTPLSLKIEDHFSNFFLLLLHFIELSQTDVLLCTSFAPVDR